MSQGKGKVLSIPGISLIAGSIAILILMHSILELCPVSYDSLGSPSNGLECPMLKNVLVSAPPWICPCCASMVRMKRPHGGRGIMLTLPISLLILCATLILLTWSSLRAGGSSRTTLSWPSREQLLEFSSHNSWCTRFVIKITAGFIIIFDS